MAATIASETYQSLTKKGAKVQNAQIARKFALGSWTKLRIGVMFWVSPDGTIPSAGSVLTFGLNAGTSNLPGDASCSHFVGLRTVAAVSGAADLIWIGGPTDANSTSRHYINSAFRAVSKLVGTTYTPLTTNNTLTAYDMLIGPCTIGTAKFKQAVQLIDFQRVSGTQMTVTYYSPTGAGFYSGTYVWTSDDFLRIMESGDPINTTINSVANWFANISAGTNQITNAAVNESVDGTLDTVVFAWNRSVPYVVVNDLAVVRLA